VSSVADTGRSPGAADRRIDQTDVRCQGHRDAHEAVVYQVRIIARLVAVLAEVVGVNRPEQRIIRIRVVRTRREQPFEPGSGAGGRQLKTVGRHMTVGAGPTVASQIPGSAPIERDAPAPPRHMAARRS
jgi:hypothetical protein